MLLALKLLQCVHFGLPWVVLCLELLTFYPVPRGVLYFFVTTSFAVVVLFWGWCVCFSRCTAGDLFV